MVEEILVDGVPFISGRRAASLIGFSPDYISRWCREGLVDARRLAGGVWYVSAQSLRDYLALREERKRAWREQLRDIRRDERQHNQPHVRLA